MSSDLTTGRVICKSRELDHTEVEFQYLCGVHMTYGGRTRELPIERLF
jgi:hypothetical protein